MQLKCAGLGKSRQRFWATHSHMISLLSLCYLLRARIITKLTPNCQVENSPTLQMRSTNSMSPGKTPWISPLDQSPAKSCPPIFCLLHWPAAPWEKGVSATVDPSPAQCSGTLLHSFNECSLYSFCIMGSVPGTGILWAQDRKSLLCSTVFDFRGERHGEEGTGGQSGERWSKGTNFLL